MSRAASLQVGFEELWERQHQLTSILTKARVNHILEGLMDLSIRAETSAAARPWEFAQRWNEQNEELHTCPKVDAIKVPPVPECQPGTISDHF